MNYFLSILLLCGGRLLSQNLVMNPGFEEHGEVTGNNPALDNLRGNHVAHWVSPTGGTPDYYNRSSEYLFTQFGGPKSHTGDGMIGISVYDGKKNYREYIQGELTQPLTAGVTYHFSVYVALASDCRFAVNQLGIYFSNEKVAAMNQIIPLRLVPQATIEGIGTKEILGHWMQFKTSYTASGGEKFITIGNFSTDKKTPAVETPNGEAGFPYAYYYLDDLVLSGEEIIAQDTTHSPVILEKPKDTLGIAPGKKLVAENIYFQTDKADIQPQSFPLLDEIIAAMKEQPGLKVEIDGHTDNVGSDEHNLALSKQRAQSVAEYFIAHGISSARITTNGYGSTRPISDNKDRNRRVEFIFSE